MPDNDFEKTVQQKMDELNFSPSESVWQKVEEQIKKEKDRKRSLLWLPLLCAFLGGLMWIYLPLKTKSPLTNKSNTLVNSGKNSSKTGHRRNTQSGEQHAVYQLAENAHKGRYMLLKTEKKSPYERIAGKTNTPSGNKKENKIAGVENDRDHLSNEVPNNVPGNRESAFNEIAKSDSNIQKKQPSVSSMKKDSVRESLSKNKSKPAGKKRLVWGISGGAGISSLSMNFHQSNAFSYNYAAAPPPSGYFAVPTQKPSLSFNAGLQLQIQLSKTTYLFSGIQYTYSGIKMEGQQRAAQPLALNSGNSSVQNILAYSAVPGTSKYHYTNQYHFIEIPLGIEKQLSNQSRFSVNAGISVARLISINAWQYDPQSGIYFKDNGQFNKTQLNVFGGLQYRLLQKEKYSLKLGPQVQYGLTDLMNNKSVNTAHLFSWGIKLVLIHRGK